MTSTFFCWGVDVRSQFNLEPIAGLRMTTDAGAEAPAREWSGSEGTSAAVAARSRAIIMAGFCLWLLKAVLPIPRFRIEFIPKRSRCHCGMQSIYTIMEQMFAPCREGSIHFDANGPMGAGVLQMRLLC